MRLSVVIPTVGRSEQLRRLLDELDTQHRHPQVDSVEVVVAVDHDRGAAVVDLDRRSRGGWPVRVVEVVDKPAHHGAGVARNAGAAAADGDVVVFLDDDVIPVDRELLAAHAAVHADPANERAVALGACLPETGSGNGPFLRGQRQWWLRQHGRLEAGITPSPRDVMAGNVSVRKAFLEIAGGFSSLRRREDWELGSRVLRIGGRLVAAPNAAVRHDVEDDIGRALRDRVAEGWADAVIDRGTRVVSGPKRRTFAERGLAAALPTLQALERRDLERSFRLAFRAAGRGAYRSGWRAATKELNRCAPRS